MNLLKVFCFLLSFILIGESSTIFFSCTAGKVRRLAKLLFAVRLGCGKSYTLFLIALRP